MYIHVYIYIYICNYFKEVAMSTVITMSLCLSQQNWSTCTVYVNKMSYSIYWVVSFPHYSSSTVVLTLIVHVSIEHQLGNTVTVWWLFINIYCISYVIIVYACSMQYVHVHRYIHVHVQYMYIHVHTHIELSIELTIKNFPTIELDEI